MTGFCFFCFRLWWVFCFIISDCDGFLFFQFQIVTFFFIDSIVTGFFHYFDCDGFFFTTSIVTGFCFHWFDCDVFFPLLRLWRVFSRHQSRFDGFGISSDGFSSKTSKKESRIAKAGCSQIVTASPATSHDLMVLEPTNHGLDWSSNHGKVTPFCFNYRFVTGIRGNQSRFGLCGSCWNATGFSFIFVHLKMWRVFPSILSILKCDGFFLQFCPS